MTDSFMSRLTLVGYFAVMNLAAPLVGLVALPWLLVSRKRRKTLLPRLGLEQYPGSGTVAGAVGNRSFKPVWVHALSVGELLSCVPLLRELRQALPPRPLVLSVSTLAAHELATEQLAADVDALFYFPYDLLWPVRRCLQELDPALFLLIETDLWPGFLAAMRRRGIPCFLLNARLSPASFRVSRWFSALFRPAFATFDRIYPQSREERQRFLELGIGAEKLQPPGNLKFDRFPLLPSPAALSQARRDLGMNDRALILLAGSTHPGEEALLRSAFLALRKDFPELRLVIVPRHPNRAEAVVQLFANDSVSVVRSSRPPSAKADVVVVDRMGLLSSLYALADVTFVGGSLVKKGGQNPIEPAAAGKPVLFGPDMSDFPEIARWLLDKGGAISVQTSDDLADHVRRLLANPSLARAMGSKARSVVDEHQGCSRKIVADIVAFLADEHRHLA